MAKIKAVMEGYLRWNELRWRRKKQECKISSPERGNVAKIEEVMEGYLRQE